MKNYLLIIFFAFFIINLSGCGSRIFTQRETNPVLEDYIGTWPARELGTLATTAGHRVNVIRMSDGKTVDEYAWQRGEFCNEPPPDAAVNVAGVFAAAIAAKIKPSDTTGTGADAEGSGSLEFYRSVATIMSPLVRRSQGLQWNRDGLSFVCNAYLNRVITKAEYLKLVNKILEDSKELITSEISHLPKLDVTITGAPPGSPVAPTHTPIQPTPP